jgi:hypothetical protein
VETILDSRYQGRGRVRQFLIHWKGYDSSHDSWEPEEFLTTCPDLLKEFLSDSQGCPSTELTLPESLLDSTHEVLEEQVIRCSPHHLSKGSVSILALQSARLLPGCQSAR